MLEYFSYKKIKKHQAEKAEKASKASTPIEQSKGKGRRTAVQTPPPAVQAPVLNEEDEYFLERIVSAEGTPPPLPERPSHQNLRVAGDSTGNNAQMIVHESVDKDSAADGKGKGKENEKSTTATNKKANRFSFLNRNKAKKVSLPPFELSILFPVGLITHHSLKTPALILPQSYRQTKPPKKKTT